MRFDKFTTKFQQAFADAQSIAVGNDNPYIEPQHLLLALLNQEDGSTASLCHDAAPPGGVSRYDVVTAVPDGVTLRSGVRSQRRLRAPRAERQAAHDLPHERLQAVAGRRQAIGDRSHRRSVI